MAQASGTALQQYEYVRAAARRRRRCYVRRDTGKVSIGYNAVRTASSIQQEASRRRWMRRCYGRARRGQERQREAMANGTRYSTRAKLWMRWTRAVRRATPSLSGMVWRARQNKGKSVVTRLRHICERVVYCRYGETEGRRASHMRNSNK